MTAATLYGYEDASPGDKKLRENLLSVKVFFQSLNIRNIKESIKYDLITSIYAVGGAISLYLGMSISMLFEVFELIVDWLFNLFTYCSGKNRKVTFNFQA